MSEINGVLITNSLTLNLSGVGREAHPIGVDCYATVMV